MQEQITQEDQWKIISCYFQEKGLVSQQIESFESFLDNLNDITKQYGEFRVAVTNQYNLGQDTDTSGRQEYRFKIISIRKNDNMIFQGDAIKPMEARLRSLTYSLEYFVDIEQKVFNILDGQEIQQGETQIYQKIKLCDMPIMVRSSLCCLHDLQPSTRIDYGECQLDQGGYFIINGSEKVIVAQERQAYNVVFLFSSKSEKEPWRIEINSMPETGGLPNKFTLVLENDNEQKGFVITAKIKGVNSGVPLFLLMRALGLRSDKEILEAIFYDLEDEDRLDTIQDTLEMLKPSTLQSAGYTNSKDCIKFIGNRTSSDQINKTQEYDEEFFYKRGQGIIQSYLLPHIGKEKASCRNKAFFIGYMVQRLLDAQLGKCGEDDRDHYGNKRIDMAGALMTQLFKEKFLKYIKTATTLTHKFIQEKSKRNKGEFNGQKIQGIKDFFDSTSLTRGLFNALATGNWGVTAQGEIAKFGVSQVLKRDTSLFATMSHLRRLNAPIKASTKIAKPRQLHNTHFGMICPAETPEGAKIGIVKNLTLISTVSNGYSINDNNKIKELIYQCKLITFDENFDTYSIPKLTKVFYNGDWMGFTKNPQKFVSNFKKLRQHNSIFEVSIVRDIVNNQIKIYSDQGRCMRPLLITKQNEYGQNQVKITKDILEELEGKEGAFSEMLADGYIEYLDVEEEEGSFIATDLNHLYNQKLSYTHLEIHPAMILGVCASVIPFGNHNQGPRNTLQSAMGKQAMALNSTNFNIRLDTLFHILYYPQIPLASSKSLEFITAKDLPIGSNGVVGIACFTGYNQEDSILFNQSSIERGFMRSMFYRTYTEIETRVENDSSKERITEINLEKVSVTDASDFTKLDRDGIISPEQPVVGDAVLVGKVIEFAPDIEGNERKPKNVSLKARRTEFGHVDTVMISTNSKGHKIVKIRIRSKRVPQIGDKFASRHGQKGTVGMTFRQEDLPFNIEGIIPDIIINPHCIPSRMTIGHMIEQLSSKVASLTGVEGNATPFYGTSMHDISRELHENGYQKLGNEVLYNPFTGLRMDNQIFFGPTFYQRLRHLVDDKMYSRHRGPIQNLTRQPTHGRSVHGGLRFGEMERDCILSHGTSRFLKERTFEVSDMFRVHVCSSCGLFAKADLDKQEFSCKGCDYLDDKNKKNYKIVQVYLPYATKLLIQELMSVHIVPRIRVDIKESTRQTFQL